MFWFYILLLDFIPVFILCHYCSAKVNILSCIINVRIYLFAYRALKTVAQPIPCKVYCMCRKGLFCHRV